VWEAHKDITLDELRVSLAGAGLIVANATLHRFFVRHGITRKKRPAMRSSRTGPTSLSKGRPGSTISSTSIRSGSCSSMRSGRRPT
jgi:hypothetical protein